MNILATSSDKKIQYRQKKLYLLAMIFLLIGAFIWLIVGILGRNSNPMEWIFGRDSLLTRIIYIVVGISAVMVVFHRDFYLPFLGPAHVPCAGLEDRHPPGATMEIEIKVEPKAKIIYWAAEPESDGLKTLATWKEAYASYENTGVATADLYGRALLKVRRPQPYTVPRIGRLNPHVHYRVCAPAGWMGRVETAWIGDGFQGQIEMFSSLQYAHA